LLAAGVVPGLILAATLMVANTVIAHRENHPGGSKTDVPPFLATLRRALPALSLPLVILGGIVFGVVTPTEAGGVAVAAALGAGAYYGGLSHRAFYMSMERTAILTGSIFLVMAAASCVGYVGSLQQWPQQIARLATETGLTGTKFFLMVNVIFLAAGTVMDVPMALALLVPLFGPACLAQGIDPIHLGIVLCLNLTMGLITPPLGGCLVVVSAVTGENYWSLAKATLPFILVEILVLLLIILVPGLSLYLPTLFNLT
jgi:tripartite ATP-independent transporter DctM subunit